MLVDRDESTACKAVEKDDSREVVVAEPATGADEPLEAFKGALKVNAEATAKEWCLCCREAGSPEGGEQNNTVVVVAAAATAVDQIVLRFIGMQRLLLEIIILLLIAIQPRFQVSLTIRGRKLRSFDAQIVILVLMHLLSSRYDSSTFEMTTLER